MFSMTSRSVSRRMFLTALGVGATATLLPARALAMVRRPPANFQVEELADGTWAIMEQGGNVLLAQTDDGPVMIDAKLAGVGRDLFDLVRKTAGKAPTTLINTHHHGDHTGGNWAFSDHAKFIAHRNLSPRLNDMMDRFRTEANRAADEDVQEAAEGDEKTRAQQTLDELKNLSVEDFAPDQEFIDQLTLKIGGRTFELRHYGNGHTDNDAVIFMPEENIIHMGDLLFNNLWPFIDRSARADTRGWQRSLEESLKLTNDDTKVVPGHGNIARHFAIRSQISFFHNLREVVSTSIRAGLSKEQVAALEPAQFAEMGFTQIRPRTLTAMYEEIEQEFRGG